MAAPSGMVINAIRYPWSSSGTSPPGTRSNTPPMPTSTSTNSPTASRLRRSSSFTMLTYFPVSPSNHPLNLRKKTLGSPCPGLSSRAHRAGVKVRATAPEMTTDTAMVMANCWYMRPAMPPVKATGMNTAHSTSTMAITGPVTSCMALAVALRGGSRR